MSIYMVHHSSWDWPCLGVWSRAPAPWFKTDVFNEREIIDDQKNLYKETEEQAKKYYDNNFAKPQDLSKHIYMESSKYDPDSIMRYW